MWTGEYSNRITLHDSAFQEQSSDRLKEEEKPPCSCGSSFYSSRAHYLKQHHHSLFLKKWRKSTTNKHTNKLKILHAKYRHARLELANTAKPLKQLPLLKKICNFLHLEASTFYRKFTDEIFYYHDES